MAVEGVRGVVQCNHMGISEHPGYGGEGGEKIVHLAAMAVHALGCHDKSWYKSILFVLLIWVANVEKGLYLVIITTL